MLALALSMTLFASPFAQAGGALPVPESPAQVMAVPEELHARLEKEVLAKSFSQRERFNRLQHLFFDSSGLNLKYRDDATQSVAQSYATRNVNCLSFTMIFTALAREAGLDAQPQEIRKTLAWRQDGAVLYRVDHINTIVRIHGTSYVVDILGNAVITLEKPVPVSDRRLLAHYYNNLAMDRLESGQLAVAQRNMDMALQLDPGYANNWSNAGVLMAHEGNPAGAQRAYERALAIEPDNISALANLASLAGQQGDATRAKELRVRLEQLRQIDPLYHFLQAELDEQSGDYPAAIAHYQKAINLHGNEPRFHEALARAYLKSGDKRSAITALRRAMRWSSGAEREGYRRQLDALQPT